MKKEKKKLDLKTLLTILSVVGLVFAPLLAPIISAYSNTVSISGSVTIPTNCIFSVNVATVNFGSVASGTNTLTQNDLAVTDGGNTGSNVLTSATDWTYLSNTINKANTFYANTLNVGLTDPRTAFETGASVDTKINVNTVSANQIYFGVNVPSSQTNPGTYSSTISIISSC